MRNKITSLLAATLSLIAGAVFGFQEIGERALMQAALYAVFLSAPLLVFAWKYKDELLRIKYAGPIGILVGGMAWKVSSGYSKVAYFTFALMVGVMFIFLSIIYTDKELEQKEEQKSQSTE